MGKIEVISLKNGEIGSNLTIVDNQKNVKVGEKVMEVYERIM